MIPLEKLKELRIDEKSKLMPRKMLLVLSC